MNSCNLAQRIADRHRQKGVLIDQCRCAKLDVECWPVFEDAPNFKFVTVDRVDLPIQQTFDRYVPSGCFDHDRLGKIPPRKPNIGATGDHSDPSTKFLQDNRWRPAVCFLGDRCTIEKKRVAKGDIGFGKPNTTQSTVGLRQFAYADIGASDCNQVHHGIERSCIFHEFDVYRLEPDRFARPFRSLGRSIFHWTRAREKMVDRNS